MEVKCPKFLYCAQGFHDFEVNFNLLLIPVHVRLDGLLVLLLTFCAGDRGSISGRTTNYFWLLHWFYLINSWKMNLFFSIFCQGTKTVMLLPHTDVIIEQYPIEFCLVHWKKNHNFVSTEGWHAYIAQLAVELLRLENHTYECQILICFLIFKTLH